MIFPNAANQCPTCLAQEYNLSERLQRGPGGAPHSTIHQCRKCRRFARTEKLFEPAMPESPELLSICLKHIPALSSTAEPRLKLVDASWIWTEPHSMRLKVRLTVRTELLSVTVQQRVMVELHVQFKMCPDCNREYTNRTWQALVQVRQHRDGAKRGIAALEMALAKNDKVRKHVLRIDTAKNGFDFYFLSAVHAQAFSQFLKRVAPMKLTTSSKLVSTDVKNDTANTKQTTVAAMVPLCRDDLVLIHKSAKGKLSGRLALVAKMSSVIHLVDASPKRENISDSLMELSPDPYYKDQKNYRVLEESRRLTRFVVLDVELCDDASGDHKLYEGPGSGVEKYALADVQVARESDFGANDEIFTCVTHLGHLLQPGDLVMGYDLVSTLGGGDWELQESFHNSFVLPDVVLVKKVKGTEQEKQVIQEDEEDQSPTKRTTKRKERKKRLKEGKRMKELAEGAVRMGFFPEEDKDFDAELANDPSMAAELSALEKEMEALGTAGIEEPEENDRDASNDNVE